MQESPDFLHQTGGGHDSLDAVSLSAGHKKTELHHTMKSAASASNCWLPIGPCNAASQIPLLSLGSAAPHRESRSTLPKVDTFYPRSSVLLVIIVSTVVYVLFQIPYLSRLLFQWLTPGWLRGLSRKCVMAPAFTVKA